MYKTRLLMLACIIFSYISFAQAKVNNDDQAIRKSVVYFVNTIKYKKLDQTVECIYPKFFTGVPKDQFSQLLNMTYNNPFVKIEVQDMKFVSVEKPKLIEGEYFSVTNYHLKLKCDAGSMNDEMKKQIGEMLTKKYGKENVKLTKDGTFTVNALTKTVAVSKDKKVWKVVMADKEYKPQLVKVLPKKVLDKI